jgi:hypothetical protein
MEEDTKKMPELGAEKSVDSKSHQSETHGKKRILWMGVGVAALLLVAACAGIASGRSDARRRAMVFNRPPSAEMMDERGAMMSRGGQYGIERGARGAGGRRGMTQYTNENSLGISGDVTKISGNAITLNDGEQDVQVNVTSSTSYIKRGKVVKQSDVATGNSVMVVGTSDSSGVVTATRIIIR